MMSLSPAQPVAHTSQELRGLGLNRVLWLCAAFTIMLAACGSAASTSSDTAGDSTSTTTAIDEADGSATSEALSDPAEPLGDTTEAPTETVATTVAPAPAVGYGNDLARPDERSNWTGIIGDDIAIDLWLAQSGDFVTGEITYASSGEPIVLLGSRIADGDWYFLEEYQPDGTVSGYLTFGSVQDGVISDSTWGELPLSLDFVDAQASDDPFGQTVVPGIYQAVHAPFLKIDDECCGPQDRLTLTAVTDDSVTIQIENVTSAPSFNMALVERTVIPRQGAVASYELEDEFVDCAFDIHLFDGFVFVTYVDDRFDCAFGNAAGVEGSYLLTTPFVSEADSPFFDEPLGYDAFGPIALGDTWASLTAEVGMRPYDADLDGAIFDECAYVRLEDDPLSPWLMMLGTGDTAVVSRIEIDDPSTRTATGVGVGSTEAEVRLAYNNAIDEQPHKYLGPGAKYLRVISDKADRDVSTILFETDEQGIVTSMRNGFADPIGWVEGCA